MIYLRVTPPDAMPVALAELKAHTRREAGDTAEDTLLTAFLEAAVQQLDGPDGTLHRCLLTQEWTGFADAPEPVGIRAIAPFRAPSLLLASARGYGCPRGFRIDLGPVQTDLTIHVEYRSGGAWLTLSDMLFSVEPDALGGALVVLNPGVAWPVTDPVPRAWRVTFTAGYGDDPADVPAPIRAAILLMAADLDNNRDGKTVANLVDNPTVTRLLTPYRRISV